MRNQQFQKSPPVSIDDIILLLYKIPTYMIILLYLMQYLIITANNIMCIGVYFELNGKVYLNNSALPLTDIGEGTRHSTVGRIRRSVVERCQTGLGSSTTPVECKSPLKVNSMASIATEATSSYV